MHEFLSPADLGEALLAELGNERRIVALAGAPGSGKSTTAEMIAAHCNARQPGSADILPMDGFHYDDRVLEARGHRDRKGAPHTFDLDGFRVALERLRSPERGDVAVPVFDRSIEIARAGAKVIVADTRIVLAEGNYLLLDEPGWRDLAPLFDRTVLIAVSEPVLVARLVRRWQGFDYPPEAIKAKLEVTDLPNLRLILSRSRDPDMILRNDGG